MSVIAVLTGTVTRPVLELTFDRDATHRTSGVPLRTWVKTLPGARWDPAQKVWLVTGTGPKPDKQLTDAGFDLIGPDGRPTFAADLVLPVAVPRPTDPDGLWQVHPRLGGLDIAAAHFGPGVQWRAGEHVWLVHPSLLLENGEIVGWLDGDDRLLSAGKVPIPVDGHMLRYDGTLDGLRGVRVTSLNCVTATAATALAGVGVESVFDLLHMLPRRYIDLSAPVTAATAGDSGKAAIVGRVTKVTPADGKGMLKATITDADGVRLSCRWFNAAYMAKRLPAGGQVVIYGRVERWTSASGYSGFGMTNPLVERVEPDSAGRIIGFYPQSGKHDLSTWTVYHAAREAVERLGTLSDPVPRHIVERRGLLSRTDAFGAVHDPDSVAKATAGRDRLAYDELLRLQLVVAAQRAAVKADDAYAHDPAPHLVDRFLSGLPYQLTAAQRNAVADISKDMAAATPAHRLLQGDVGCGKTVVAISAMLTAISSGWQAAFMAPTEILAVQHHADIEQMLAGLAKPDGTPVRACLLTNKTTGKAKKELLGGLADGSIDLVVGTHALLSEQVRFKHLSCVVLDEQHRFGVEQRQALRAKGAGRSPDVLYASATPIPRTAAMTVFGDLDVSIMDEMPAGRSPIETVHVPFAGFNDRTSEVWRRVRGEVDAGRQAFVVCPLVKESATRQDAAAHATAADLAAGVLAGLRIGVVTGKDRPVDRAETMAAFAAGTIDVLVATTVIEVGVNVPNATIMVVLGADKFGLAQLHQLRGRVGRGQHAGTCFLVADPRTSGGRDRMKAMVDTGDGFVLAEMDLQIRGAGHISGAAQSGTGTDLRVADIVVDTELLGWAKADASELVERDPHLAAYPSLRAEIENAVDVDARRWLLTA